MAEKKVHVNLEAKDKTGPLDSFLKSMGSGAGTCVGLCVGVGLIIFLFTFLIGAGGSDNPESVTTTSTSSTTTTSTVPVSVSIGERIELSGIAYTVLGVSKTQSIGNYGLAEAKGVYVVVEMEIENTSKESKYVTANFKLIDDQDRKFDSDSTAEVYASSPLYLGENLQPGLPVRGTKIYDVPESASGFKLEVTGNWLSNKKTYVDLDI